MEVLPISNWRTPVSNIPQQSIGNFHIKHRIVKAGTVLDMDVLGYDYCYYCEDTPMVILREGILENNDTESVWMSDSPMEYYMAWELVAQTKGPNVLVGGLGLGLLVHLLTLRKDIENITVIEIVPEIIQMISPHLPPNVKIIKGDFLHEIQVMDDFNTVIADLWKTTNEKGREVFEDCKLIMYDYQQEAVQLFWAFQHEVSTEYARFTKYHIDGLKEKERNEG